MPFPAAGFARPQDGFRLHMPVYSLTTKRGRAAGTADPWAINRIGAGMTTQDLTERAVELAWAAGLFEGEGCISTSSNSLLLIMTMTDKDVVERFMRVVGCGAIKPRVYDNPKFKDAWVWSVHSHSACGVLRDLLPHLGERRSAKAAEALALPAYQPRECKECGAPFMPPFCASKFCGDECRGTANKRRMRDWKRAQRAAARKEQACC